MAGYDEAGVGGIKFFVGVAGQLTVNSDIVDNPSLIAASGVPGGKVDGGNARKMAEQIGPDTSYRDVVVQLGVESQTITRRTQMQQTITDQLDAERESVSGVNIDEEMTNLVAFQHASSRSAEHPSELQSLMRISYAVFCLN